MAIILDADVIIRGEKRRFNLEQWLVEHADEEFQFAAITVAELWHGVARASGAHRATREAYVERLLEVLPIAPYTGRTAYVHAQIWAQLLAAGTMIGYYDLIVAASALEADSVVATFNSRHFSSVPGLEVVTPA